MSTTRYYSDEPMAAVDRHRVALLPLGDGRWWAHCHRCGWMSGEDSWVPVLRDRAAHTCPKPVSVLEDDHK
jgi:hypothetical protein